MSTIIFERDGKSVAVSEEEAVEMLASGAYADTPAYWGIETCPGVEPDLVLAARRAEIAGILNEIVNDWAKDPADVEMPGDGTDLASMSIEQLQEVACNRNIEIDRRWGKIKLIEALSDDRT